MKTHVPPRVATWLLARLGSRYYSESLAGDLIEEYQQGRGRIWYWRQVAMAILVARIGRLRTTVWTIADSLIAAFAMIALGVGTLTWANAVKKEADPPQRCAASDSSEHIDCPVARGEYQ
jgi:hypothetical protein